jgi:hypothetical protein
MDHHRTPISQPVLIEILLNATAIGIGRDASFLRSHIEVRRREGAPNWDANCGNNEPFVVNCFAIAVDEAQKMYDLE